jgi:hypothetical protein
VRAPEGPAGVGRTVQTLDDLLGLLDSLFVAEIGRP